MSFINSNSITFMDATDTKKIDVHIASNHPTIQIYNGRTYTPDWTTTSLILTTTVYADSTDVTGLATFRWVEIKGSGTTENSLSSTSKELVISRNTLSNASMIRYKCYATYNGKEYSNEITFTCINDGVAAPNVQAQYSANGTANSWESTLDSSTHKYIRFSYDGGNSWTEAIRITGNDGEDGRSVELKGVAYAKSTPVTGNVITLYSDINANVQITNATDGDSYLVDGYLCVYNGTDFVCTGQIQGPKGDKGDSYYLFIRYADDANGSGISTSPDGKSYIGFYRSTVNQAPTSVSSSTWNWAKFVGEDAKSITLTGNAQVFKVGKSNTILPEEIKVTAQVENTSVTSWSYNTDGSTTFTNTIPPGVSLSGNVVTITGSAMTSNLITIKASDGVRSDIFTVYKVSDGSDGKVGADGKPAPIVFLTNENITFAANASGQVAETTVYCNVVAYSGTTAVTPTVGTILPSDIPSGMTINKSTVSNQVQLTIDIANNATLGSAQNNNGSIKIPISSPIETNLYLTWSKVNSGIKGDKGETGAGIKSTTVMYGTSDSASVLPTDATWQSTIPVVAEGKYLWTRTIIDYTDDTVPDTVAYTYVKQGVKGDTGSSGSSVTVKSIQYKEGESATTAPTGSWSDSVVVASEGKYLWTKTAFSDGIVAYGVARQGVSGKDGVGINSTTVDYGTSDSATVKPTTWQQDMPVVAEGKYLWTRTVTDYTDTSKADTVTYVYAKQGTKGDTGTAGSSVTVKSIRYQAGTSATVAPTSTWSDSVVAVAEGNYLWTQTTFSDNKVAYGVAKQGQKGDKGDQGVQGPKGNDGQQYYTWVKYADTPTSGMSNDPDGKTYIGLAYNKTTATESTAYSDYAWSLIRGETGAIGPKGEDGQQYYTWIKYADNASGANMSDSPNGKLYIGLAYNKTTSTESNVASDYTWALFKGDKGDKGDVGRGVTSIVEQYYQSTSATSQTGGSWSATVPTWTDGKYIWTRSVITYTDSTTSTTSPICITGQKGGTGVGVSSVDVWYYQSTSATALSGGSWSTTAPTWSDGKYIWTKTITTYTNSTTDETTAVCITGQKGSKGNDAYTVMLTNESHIFAGDVSNAIVGSAATQVLAYNGSTAQTVTIVSVNSKTATTTDTDTGIAGLKFKCSALSGTSPTITFTCTTSFVSKSGTIPIVLSVGGVQFTKMFTYSIAFKGTTGSPGNPGSPGTPASLVDITPSALYFKSTTGKDGTFTPDYIYLYPRFQTVAYSKWEYSTNGGTSWTTVTSGSNGLTIGTYNSVAYSLQIAKSSALYTDTVTSISFRCVSSNSAVYDTVSIAKIYDVVDLQIGGRNLLLNTGFDGEVNKIYNLPSSATSGEGGLTFNLSEPLSAGTEVALRFQVRGVANLNIYWMMTGGNIAQTVMSKSKISTTEFSTIEQHYTIPNGRVLNSVFICTAYGNSTPGTDWFEIKNKSLKLELGNTFTDYSPAPEDLKSTTFQLYAPKGYLLTNDTPEVVLETFAYDGSQRIANAIFAWYSWNGEAWTAISGATSTSLTLNKTNVFKSGIYKCDMTYNGKIYTATATVEDKTDIYNSLIRVNAKYSSANRMYWILYATAYSEEGERDALLGPISETAPTGVAAGAYWYKVDSANYTVTLMKYSGTAWATTTDKQELLYDWFLFKDPTDMVTLGAQSKVKIVTASDFSKVCNVQCNISDANHLLLTMNNQVLNDPSDPIVSVTEPTNPIDGQLWVKIGDNGTYVISVWSEADKKWVISEADSTKKVYVEKPTQYNAGDIWIVNNDYQPVAYKEGVIQKITVDGVEQTVKHLAGTMLKAQYPSQTYKDSDWVEALTYYKEEIDKIKDDLNTYNQFFSFDDSGLTMQAKNKAGAISEFKTKLTNTELGFYQGEDRVAYINNSQLNISKAQINDGLTVAGTLPKLSIGGFSIVQESNGSLSIVANI